MTNNILIQLPNPDSLIDNLHERIVSVTDLLVEALDLPIEGAHVEASMVDHRMRITVTLDVDFEQWFQTAMVAI
jgi:hypothetical protein